VSDGARSLVEAPSARRLPPVDHVALASIALVVVGGIYFAAHLPARPSVAPSAGLLAGAVALLLANLVMLSRIRPFAWRLFRRVAGWALLAYALIAGMLELVFILDQTRGFALLLLTLMLVVFAVDIPVLFAFSVARYQPVDERLPA